MSRAFILILMSSAPALALLYTAVSPILPQMAASLGEEPGEAALIAQLVMMMPSIGLMIGGPLSGWLVDRWGAGRLLLGACAGYALLGSAGLYLEDSLGLITSRFLLGLVTAALATATLALMAEHFDEQARARLVGYQSACGALVGLISMLAAGYVGQLAGWRAPFTFYLIALPVFVLALCVVPLRHTPAALPKHGEAASLRPLVWLILGIVPLYIAVFTSSTQVAFLLADHGVLQPTVVALVIAMSALFNAFGAAGYGWLSRQFGVSSIYLASLLSLGVGHLLLGLSQSVLLAAVGCALTGLGAGVLTPYLINRVLDRCDDRQRGRAVGVMYSAMFLGSFLNPVVLAPFSQWLGRGNAVLLVGLALLLYSAMLSARQLRLRRQVSTSAD